MAAGNSDADARFMSRAVRLSLRGYPAPNPRVGCVIVRKRQVVGEGWHQHAGGDHAELVALRSAGASARGSTVYVTLEPCAHHGKTPPCAGALIGAKVAKVHFACLDPNPIAKGGKRQLLAAGIDVEVGLCEVEAEAANKAFLTAMARKTPYVVGKTAMSLDGRVALPTGESKWITAEPARRVAQRLRAECGAVLVGRGTVYRDNPRLTARLPGIKNQPLRVILDPNNGLTGLERVFNQDAPTLHIVRNPHLPDQIRAPMRGATVDLPILLGQLFERGLTGLLVEGGPTTLSYFLKAGLVDRLEVFIAPRALGDGPAWLQGAVKGLEAAYGFEFSKVRRLGPDLWLTAFPVTK